MKRHALNWQRAARNPREFSATMNLDVNFIPLSYHQYALTFCDGVQSLLEPCVQCIQNLLTRMLLH